MSDLCAKQISECLILAAGQGSRLANVCDSKALLSVAGLPLLERTIVTASQAGLSMFYVVTGYNGENIEAFLMDLSVRRKLAITLIHNEAWEMGNGVSLLKAKEVVKGDFVLLMADHVFDEMILDDLLGQTLPEGQLILAVDRDVQGSRFVDVDDATKVLAEGQRIVDIGKNLHQYNAYDTGIFLCAPAMFEAMQESVCAGEYSLAAGVRRLALRGGVQVMDIGGRRWVDVDTPVALKDAQTMLYDDLLKPHDGYISRTVNRKFSLRLFTPLFLRLSPHITANQVSILSFGVALLAALSFFLGRAVMGGILIQLASILDGCDGEIARLKKMQSSFGNFFDAVLDRYVDSFILFGMFYYAWASPEFRSLFGSFWEPLILITAMLALSGNLMVSYTSAKSVTDFAYRYRGKWIAAGRGRDWRLFALFLGGVLAWIHPVTVFLALLVVAVLSNAIVLQRIRVSWARANTSNPWVDSRPKAIIYDFDGTIADTMHFLTELAVRLITEHYSIGQEEARTRYRETTGLDFASQIEQIFPAHPENEIVIAEFECEKRTRILDYPIFPEIFPVLRFFRDKGVQQYICSSTAQDIVVEYVKKHEVDGWVDESLGYEPDLNKSEQIALIVRKHSLRPQETLFVGDSLRDSEFVRGNNVQFIGIGRTFDNQEFLSRGLTSVPDLTALTQLWEESGKLQRSIENVK